MLGRTPMSRCYLTRISLSCALIGLSLSAIGVHAQEWTRFRGPNGSGVSQAESIPVDVSDDSYNWRVRLPGIGHSSPVVWGERVFLLSSDPETATRYALCIDAKSGKTLWQKEFASRPYAIHQRSSFSSSSPAVDDRHVYFVWAEPSATTLIAMTHEGEEVWKRDLGPYISQHGFGGSPMVYEDKVIFFHSQQKDELPADQVPGQSLMMAFDRMTGETVWSTPLKTTRVCYSVPCVYQGEDGEKQLVCHNTGNGIFGIALDTGKLLWEMPVFDKRTVASTVVVEDLIIGSCGAGNGGNFLVAVRPGETPQEVFRMEASANYVPSPIAYNDLLFMWNDRGIVSCVDMKTYQVHWRQRLSDGFSGSPVLVKDRMYCIAENGTLFVVAAESEFKLLDKHDLGEPSRATPAVSGGHMFLRTESHLISIGG